MAPDQGSQPLQVSTHFCDSQAQEALEQTPKGHAHVTRKSLIQYPQQPFPWKTAGKVKWNNIKYKIFSLIFLKKEYKY